MIKKTVTYDDYNDGTQTEDFYFNMTKDELLEVHLEYGDFEDTLKRLKETENAKEAYQMFKSLLLASYGEKAADGKTFEKSPEITKKLQFSPALSEIIMEFLDDPQRAGKFFEGVMPNRWMAEAKKRETEKAGQAQDEKILEARMAEAALQQRQAAESTSSNPNVFGNPGYPQVVSSGFPEQPKLMAVPNANAQADTPAPEKPKKKDLYKKTKKELLAMLENQE